MLENLYHIICIGHLFDALCNHSLHKADLIHNLYFPPVLFNSIRLKLRHNFDHMGHIAFHRLPTRKHKHHIAQAKHTNSNSQQWKRIQITFRFIQTLGYRHERNSA